MIATQLPSDDGTLRGWLFQRLRRWEHLGIRRLPAGTLRVGHVPHRAPQAYMHYVLPPLHEAHVEELARQIGSPIPGTLALLYSQFNGFHLFSGMFAVYGLRFSYDRSDEVLMAEQPFDLRIERLAGVTEGISGLVFGSIGTERSYLSVLSDGEVGLFAPGRPDKALMRWQGADACVRDLVCRLEGCFNDEGRDIFHRELSTANVKARRKDLLGRVLGKLQS